MANLSATKSAAAPTVEKLGGTVDYTLTIANAGPDAVVGATVTDAFPAAFASVLWAWLRPRVPPAPATGSGNINKLVNLAPLGSIVFTAQAVTRSDASGTITNNVAVVPPAGTTDPALGNNIGIGGGSRAGRPDLRQRLRGSGLTHGSTGMLLLVALAASAPAGAVIRPVSDVAGLQAALAAADPATRSCSPRAATWSRAT